jgi:uncharacterized protein (TIRG00374 family)
MSSRGNKLSIVVPAHNEEENLPYLFEKLIPALEQYPETSNFELVVVNDNSKDHTGEVIENYAKSDPRIKPVHRTTAPGFGNAIRTGFENASGDIIIPVMADLSDDPHDISKLVRKINEGYDIAYGSRFCKGGSTDGYPKTKMLANRAFNNSVRLTFGIRHKDVTNAFKAYRREVLDAIGIENIEANGFDLTVEIPLKAHILGFKSAEVPVTWHGRERGEAKLKLSQNGHRYGSRLLKMFFVGNLVGLQDLFGSVAKGSQKNLFIAASIGILLLAVIFSLSGFSDILGILSNVSLGYVGIACLMVLLTFLFRTWRWSVLLRTAGYRVPSDTAFKCIMFSWFVNYILPARIGDFARGMALKTTEKTPLSISLPTIVIERAMDLIILALMLVVTMYFFARDSPLFSIGAGAFILGISLIIVLLLVSKYDYIILQKFEYRFKFLRETLPLFKDGIGNICRNPQAILLCFLLSVPVWFFEITCLFYAARAVHFQLEFALATLAGISAFVAQSLTTTPAGIGVHEGSIAGVLMLFGIKTSIGTSIALVDHFARALVTYVVGSISAVHIGLNSREYFVGLNTKSEVVNKN